jgi:DNA-directed RNA polymerase sigma subunit (sigma70/sigma32)
VVEERVIKAQRVKELIPSEDLAHVIELAKQRMRAEQKFVKSRKVVEERINRCLVVFDLMYNGSTLKNAGEAIGASRERTRQIEAKVCLKIMKCYKIYKRSQKHGRI